MILVGTSVWIDYFHDGDTADTVEEFLDRKELCMNDIILAELLPPMQQRGECELEALLASLPKLPAWIDWSGIVYIQTENLRHGINNVGLPDLMITQNAVQNDVRLFLWTSIFRL